MKLFVSIPSEKRYWLIRTNRGSYYQEFVKDNYVAIDWNEMCDFELIADHMKYEELVESVAKIYKK